MRARTLKNGQKENMRAPPFVARARHFGARAYEHARHGLAGINRAVETGAHLYGGIVQPLLRYHGIDTGDADAALMDVYNTYAGARSTAQKIDNIIQS